MRSKWKISIVLCAIVCVLVACGRSGIPADDSPEIHHFASSDKWVYIEFDPCYPPEDIQISLTPASNKDQSNEIPLTYNSSINGCVLTLEEGSYCIRMQCASYKKEVQERYFVVDEEHSYYHILFPA